MAQMRLIPNIRKLICCGNDNERPEVDTRVTLISNEIENRKTILNDMRLLKNDMQQFGEYTGARIVTGLSSEEILNMGQNEIDDSCETEFNTAFLENCLPLKSDSRPALILDLDNTLIYSTPKKPEIYNHEISIKYNNKLQTIWVIERPHLQRFLDTLSSKYELILFTAGIRQYGIKILKIIDPQLRIEYLLDRRFCTILGRNQKGQDIYVKDLKILGRDLSRTLIIDDRDYSFCLDSANGHLIPSFDGDPGDDCLKQLQEYLLKCLEIEDFRNRTHLSYK